MLKDQKNHIISQLREIADLIEAGQFKIDRFTIEWPTVEIAGENRRIESRKTGRCNIYASIFPA